MNAMGRNTLAGELLRGFVERIENEEAQKKQHADNITAIYADAKAQGLIPKAIRYVVKARTLKPSELQEIETLRDLYMHAMGMATDAPLFRLMGLVSADLTARESVIEALKKFVAPGTSIVIESGGTPIRLTGDKDGNVSVTEVIEQPMQTSDALGKKKTTPPKTPVPDVTAAEAEAMGRQARKGDVPIISNPFPYGHVNRPHWDRGWRIEDGGDGMGPGEDD